ncbi:MAG: hypothetical protein BWX84_02261 [Verrucomicrobia bacterium ADurb.Bin118]|nr:MAG: hypothetical protein BWX84_02261 [Verrucomicrobia bacterium ADurb.Bin118]
MLARMVGCVANIASKDLENMPIGEGAMGRSRQEVAAAAPWLWVIKW